MAEDEHHSGIVFGQEVMLTSTRSQSATDRAMKQSIRDLLDLCSAKSFEIPTELKQSLLSSINADDTKGSGSLNRSMHTHQEVLVENVAKRSKAEQDSFLSHLETFKKLKPVLPNFQVRIHGGSYTVTSRREKIADSAHDGSDDEEAGPRYAKQRIDTVVSTGALSKVSNAIARFIRNKGRLGFENEEKKIVDNVNLVFETGKMYLVLGGPGSGKSTVLKMLAGLLPQNKRTLVGGTVNVGDISPGTKIYWPNLVGYIDQIDRLHPYLTVKETLDFAWRCRTGGTHRKANSGDDEEVKKTIEQLDSEGFMVNVILETLGLARVKDTFVGDQESVRGVSGGEKKRVTVAEMLCIGVPVLCCDEISTGLDAATTYDITRMLGLATRMAQAVRIVSLLQPPPETVANFDEVILVHEGLIMYSGPIEDVIPYFNGLGYEIPERMDLADWLQIIPTKEGWRFLKEADKEDVPNKVVSAKHLTALQFQEKFYSSELGQQIMAKLETPPTGAEDWVKNLVKVKFVNPWYRSAYLLVMRELLLWWRDKYFIKAKIFQTILVGVVVGTLFFQQATDPENGAANVMSVLFQSMLYCVLGSMVLLVAQFPARSIMYKQQDANFFPTWTYVLGRSIAGLPTALIDAVGYGSMIYWLVGLAYNDGASIGNYFFFMAILFVTSWTMCLVFSVFAASLKDLTTAQAFMAITGLVMVLFSGFTVQPDVIPSYYIWFYWINCMAWLLRSLVVNEFASGAYDDEVEPGVTLGEVILDRFGFVFRGEPMEFEWVRWGVLFSIGIGLMSMMASVACFNHIRFATGGALELLDQGTDDAEIDIPESKAVNIPFKKTDLTFKDVRYTVQASTSKEVIHILKGVDGVCEAGKLTALMGSSGAGKTTLMDVLAMRKTSGEITGDIRLNGHPQEEASFRRCMGYVEQFDVQSAELTIRETISFSAALRLDASDPMVTPENIEKYVDQVLNMLELTNLQHLQVGSDEAGGLSFEQRKRLSIAVEVAANPSVLFLDEPTSGLDARAAAIVMRGIKRVTRSGRCVVATIHQPSVAIFDGFDNLLLLKRGGETVFFGELGTDSKYLIDYLERYDATPKISPGENPATWMLTTIGAGSAAVKGFAFDYAAAYAVSDLRQKAIESIDSITSAASPDNRVAFSARFATSSYFQAKSVMARTFKVYNRSPAYNRVRLIVSCVIALLFSSVYASQKVPKNESDMNSRINSIFIAVVFVCVNSQNSALRVIERERNMFYRHKAALMYNTRSILTAFSFAEIPFIVLSGFLFWVCFYFLMGFSLEASSMLLFLLFMILALATFTFNGHMMVVLLRDVQTAQGLGGLITLFSSMFSGILIRAENIPNFWIWLYWIMPGHYIMNGILMSQFHNDMTLIEASPDSVFYNYIGCTENPCYGTVSDWMAANFITWSYSDIKWDIVYLVVVTILTRILSWYGLTYINYRAT